MNKMYTNAIDECDNEKKGDGDLVKKKLGEFASKISIAGIEDAYKAESPFLRGLFLWSIVVFAMAMLYSSCNVGIRYARENAIALNWRPIDNEPAPPFPNVTICFPVLTNDRAKKDLIYSNPAVQRKMRRLNVSQEDASDFLVSKFFQMGSSLSPHEMRLAAVAETILDASVGVYGMRGFLQRLMVSCERSFSNCYFDGIEFDCCRAATLMANFNTGVCWELNLGGIINTTNSSLDIPSADRLNMNTPSGLSIEVGYDRDSVTFDDDQMTSDGFIVLLDPPNPFSSSPAIVPSDADARIVLAPPVRNRDIDRCEVEESHRESAKFADRYDARGMYCAAERLIKLCEDEIGCNAPVLTYYPDETNDTVCNAAVLTKVIAMSTSNGGAFELSIDGISELMDDAAKRKLEAMAAKYEPQIRDIIAGRMCSPMCQRWTYAIWSTSYGYIKYEGDEFEHNWATGNPRRRDNRTSAISRLRVFFPTTSYEMLSQEEVALSYLAFCEIASVWGVYLGFSIVTFVQVMAYGVVMLKVVRKQRRNKVAHCERRSNEM